MKRQPSRLTNAVIDRYFAQAAATIREVEQQLKPCFVIPASARNLILK